MGRQGEEGLVEGVSIISLSRCPERREFVTRQCATRGVPYSIIEAADGQAPETMEEYSADPEAFRKLYGKPPTRGEFGCYVSHLLALEAGLGEPGTHFCVMEDDVEITRDWEEIQEITARQFGELGNFDLFYPGVPVMQGTERTHDTGRPMEHSVQLSVPPVGTQCYIVSVEFAEYFLHNFKTFYRPIDQMFRAIARLQPRKWGIYAANAADRWCKHNYGIKSEVRKK